MRDHDAERPPSKFEWRPEDVQVLSDEESTRVLAEYAVWLASHDEKEGS